MFLFQTNRCLNRASFEAGARWAWPVMALLELETWAVGQWLLRHTKL